MMESGLSQFGDHSVEGALFDALTRGDAAMASAGPILRHMLENDDHSMFTDEIVARVRGMVSHVARQLLAARADACGVADPHDFAEENAGNLTETLIGSAALLAHAHALALEFQLSERLQARHAIDPVLSPLLQALIASSDTVTAGAAMNLLAAQARFGQQQRRMELPLEELPGELFHAALLALRGEAGEQERDTVAALEARMREEFDESQNRLSLLTRLVVGMGSGSFAALNVAHAGGALFLTALALASGQNRATAVIASNERQMARFALSLRAAGLAPGAVEEQFAYLHPDVVLPEGFPGLSVDRAAEILASSPVEAAG